MARISGRRPASTAASRTPRAVSSPLIPLAASPNSTALSTCVCGAWSVAMASAVPSRSAARQAAASPGVRRGGLTRSDDAYGCPTSAPSAHGSSLASHAQRRAPATHSSQSARWWGVMSQVTGNPSAFARRTRSSAPAVDRWVRCNRAPGTSRMTSASTARSRATADPSAADGQPRRPSTVATYPSCASAPAVSDESSA